MKFYHLSVQITSFNVFFFGANKDTGRGMCMLACGGGGGGGGTLDLSKSSDRNDQSIPSFFAARKRMAFIVQ